MNPTSLLRFARPLAAALAVAFAAAPTLAPAQLPSLGDAGDWAIGAERRIGDKVARELYRDPDYIEDPVLDEYVLGIWQRLLAAARTRGELTPDIDERFAWQVLLGKDRIINAFALPGGWLGLQLGLVNVTATRDELASVLAHELSHVTQRHISRMAAQERKQMPLMMAALILGAVAMGKNADLGNALLVGSQAMAMQNSINYTRDMEREADRIGYGVATQAGFDPHGFVGMFEKLQQATRLSDNGNYPYLRTHPMNTERIAEMQSRQQLLAPMPAPAEPDLVHAMMVARSRVLSNPGSDGLRAFGAEADGPTVAAQSRARQATLFYAAALAATKLREFDAANRYIARLAPVASGDAAATRQVALLTSEAAFAAGDMARAVRALDRTSKERPELIYAAQAQVRAGSAGEIAQRLQTWVAVHPRDWEAWELLSKAWAAQGQTARSIRAEAESFVARMDYSAALDRFRAAQEFARKGGVDHIEASIIDSRAREVQSLLREQALER